MIVNITHYTIQIIYTDGNLNMTFFSYIDYSLHIFKFFSIMITAGLVINKIS